MVSGLWFRVQNSGFKMYSLRFTAEGSGFRVQDPGFGTQGVRLRIRGSGFRIQDSGLMRAQGLGFGCPFQSNPYPVRSAFSPEEVQLAMPWAVNPEP